MKENDLKRLNTELKQLKKFEQDLIDKRKVLQNDVNNNVSKCKTLRKSINEKEKEIKKISTSKKTIVSEHAILRYLERVCGMDIENVKTLILNEEFKTLKSLTNGDGAININGISYILKDNVIVTIK